MAKETKTAGTVQAVAVKMKQDKVCKSCVRFAGQGEAGEKVCASVYIQNDAMAQLGNPDEITLHVSV